MIKPEKNLNSLVIIAACMVICAVYGIFFFRYVTNVPRVDDFYDTLFFLHLYNNTDGWVDKLNILFWQYSDHRAVTTRIVSLIYYSFNHRVDFFYLSLIGALQLIPAAYFLWFIFKPRTGGIDVALLIPFMLLLSFAHWKSAYWAMTAVSNFSAVFFAVTIVWLIQSAKKSALVLAALLTILLPYTQENGVFMPLLAVAQVMFSDAISKNIKRSYGFFAVVIIFLSSYTEIYHHQYAVSSGITVSQYLQDISFFKVVIGFFVLIGATPFLGTDLIIFPAAFGLVVLGVLVWMMRWMWRHDKYHFYPAAVINIYILLSLMACSLTRVPFLGLSEALDSHYKIYSLVLISVALTFLFQQFQHSKVRWIFIGCALALLINSYVRDSKLIVSDQNNRQNEITEWAVKGTHSSLGGSGWVPLSEQILFTSVSEKLYSPFDSARGALYQHNPPIQLEACPVTDTYSIVQARLQNWAGTIAARLQVADSEGSFASVFLCGEKFNYQLLPYGNDAVKRMTIDKTHLLPDTYIIFLKRVDGSINKVDSPLVVPVIRPEKACEADQSPTINGRQVVLRVRQEVEKKLCHNN